MSLKKYHSNKERESIRSKNFVIAKNALRGKRPASVTEEAMNAVENYYVSEVLIWEAFWKIMQHR